MQDYSSFINDQIQYKRHIIITGSRGSGKSTLLKKIIGSTKIRGNIPGVITWCEPGVAVYMRLDGHDDVITIGTYNQRSTSHENRMKPVKKGFNVYGVILLEKLVKDDSEWVSIDEIGYLENASDKYTEKLKQLFCEKRVLAVVRKQETKLIKEILSRKDALVIDLDLVGDVHIMRKKVAFICVHNSCRSQMAEAIGNHLYRDVLECYSAGTELKNRINQDAVRIVKEIYGIDMNANGHHSKLIDEIPAPDIAISMGCDVGCPFVGRPFDDDWGLADPTGKDDKEFRAVIAEIENKLKELADSVRVGDELN